MKHYNKYTITISNKNSKLQATFNVVYKEGEGYNVNNINIKSYNLKLDIATIEEIKKFIYNFVRSKWQDR